MLRVSLTLISDKKSRDIELILFERDIIAETQALRTKSIEIKKALNFIKSIVQIIIKINSIYKNDVFKFRSDKFNMFTDCDRKYIIKYVRVNSRIIYAQLKLKTEISCFKFIPYRTLKLYELIN